jgi:hypothetical protein
MTFTQDNPKAHAYTQVGGVPNFKKGRKKGESGIALYALWGEYVPR